MNPFTFTTITSGTLGYKFGIIPVASNRPFDVFLGNSGVVGGVTGVPLLGFSGVSGKLYDNDENYIYSYKNEGISISGHAFDTYHCYYINDEPVNFNCSRKSGALNQLFLTGLPMANVTAVLRGKNHICCGNPIPG